jgi:hypothetical protein
MKTNRKELTQAQINTTLVMLSSFSSMIQESMANLRSQKGIMWQHCDKESERGAEAFQIYSDLRKDLKRHRKELAFINGLIKTLKSQR